MFFNLTIFTIFVQNFLLTRIVNRTDLKKLIRTIVTTAVQNKYGKREVETTTKMRGNCFMDLNLKIFYANTFTSK